MVSFSFPTFPSTLMVKTIFRPSCRSWSSVKSVVHTGLYESYHLRKHKAQTCELFFEMSLLSGLFFPLSDMSYLLCVFSVGRWWVGLYHVWSTGITGVFCRAAQVSQCGSLSKGVSNISLWKSNLPESWCLFLLICFTTGNSTNPQIILTMIAEKESSLFSPCQKGTLKL